MTPEVPAIELVKACSGGQVVKIAVTLVDATEEAEGEVVGNGASNVTSQNGLTVVAQGHANGATVGVQIRFCCHYVDHPGRGIFSKESALRAAQYFDPFYLG